MDMWRTLTECDRMWRVCFQTARMWAKKPHCQVSADENYMCKFHSPTKYLWVGQHEAFVVTCVPGASWSFFSLKSGGVLETLCDRGWIFFVEETTTPQRAIDKAPQSHICDWSCNCHWISMGGSPVPCGFGFVKPLSLSAPRYLHLGTTKRCQNSQRCASSFPAMFWGSLNREAALRRSKSHLTTHLWILGAVPFFVPFSSCFVLTAPGWTDLESLSGWRPPPWSGRTERIQPPARPFESFVASKSTFWILLIHFAWAHLSSSCAQLHSAHRVVVGWVLSSHSWPNPCSIARQTTFELKPEISSLQRKVHAFFEIVPPLVIDPWTSMNDMHAKRARTLSGLRSVSKL